MADDFDTQDEAKDPESSYGLNDHFAKGVNGDPSNLGTAFQPEAEGTPFHPMASPEVAQANPQFDRWGSVLSAGPNGPTNNALGQDAGGYMRYADGSLHQSANGMDARTYEKNAMNLKGVNEGTE